MLKTVVLIPVRDNEGHPFPRSYWKELADRFSDIAGGYSWAPGQHGVWVSPGGRSFHDRSRAYTVALESWFQLPQGLETIRWIQERFRQEALYTRLPGCQKSSRLSDGAEALPPRKFSLC